MSEWGIDPGLSCSFQGYRNDAVSGGITIWLLLGRREKQSELWR